MENSSDGKSARNQMKKEILKTFKAEGQNDLNNFTDFYKLTKTLNKIFK
jgi:hypothetical protein